MSRTTGDIVDRPPPTGSAPFKLGMRRLAGGVSVVCGHDAAGGPVGLTATSVSSLSADPPSLLVCINRRTDLAAVLVDRAPFSVNVLAASQVAIAKAFGGQLDVRGAGRFAHGSWHRSTLSEVPMLVGCRAVFECLVADVHDWQSHHVVIGTVVDVHFPAIDEPPLAYCDGAYGTLSPLPGL